MKRFLLALAFLGLIGSASPAFAACGDGASACFWIGGGANANWNTTGNWSNTSGGASSGTTPATGDSICFDSANSGASTINASRSILSINTAGTCTGGSASAYTGTITHSAAVTLTVTGNDAGANGGTTFLISSSSGWTASNATTSAVAFSATSGTITFTPNSSGASRNFGNVTFGSTGSSTGTFTLGSTVISAATSVLTLTAGTFDNNSLNLTYGSFSSSNSNTRALSNATGTWSLISSAGATILDLTTTTNFTSISTAFSGLTISVSGAVAGARGIIAGSAMTIGTLNVGANSSGGLLTLSAPSSATLTITNFTATSPAAIRVAGSSSRAYTFTNSVTLTGTANNPIAFMGDGGGSAFPVITGSFSGDYVTIGQFTFGAGTQSFTNCFNYANVTSSGTFSCAPPAAGGGRIIGG